MVPEEWPSRTIRKDGALQNPAYRPADMLNEGLGATTPGPSPFVIQNRSLHERSDMREQSVVRVVPNIASLIRDSAPPRDYAAIFCSNAISASGAVTLGEWLASIS